ALSVSTYGSGGFASCAVNVSVDRGVPNVSAGADKVLNCVVASVVLDGSSTTPNVTYSWAGPGIVLGGTTATPTVNLAGTYTLTVSNTVNGCVASDVVGVNEDKAVPEANAGGDKQITCAGATVVLDGCSRHPERSVSWTC